MVPASFLSVPATTCTGASGKPVPPKLASVTHPVFRQCYGLIDWHPPENAATNDEIASIELPHGRIVALSGGSVYYLVRKTPQ